ncbi:MAG: prepilin-type N-terminal cleavage/methylation domain-containing protein [Gemmatimonadota bacterium]
MPTPRPTSRGGFSLIELLVAMLVFAILVSIAIARYRNVKERAYLAEMKTDLGNLRIAEEAYWSEQAQYTADQTLLDYRTGSRVTVTITVTDPYEGYDAEAVHVSAPTVTCTMYVGRGSSTGTPSGDVACH